MSSKLGIIILIYLELRGTKMLIFDKVEIGNRLYMFRKKSGLTQFEVAEAADISPRTYAGIERGEASMRIETALNICNVLKITPNDLFMTEEETGISIESLVEQLNNCSPYDRDTALALMATYLNRQALKK